MILIKLIVLNLVFVAGWWLSSNWWLPLILSVFLIWLAGIWFQQFWRGHLELENRLHEGLLNLLDGHYAVEIRTDKSSPSVFELFNKVTNSLADQRGHFYQREQLLDKVVNSTDVYTLIINHRQQVIFANRPSIKGLPDATSIVGSNWNQYVRDNMPKLEQVLTQGQEGIVSIHTAKNAPQSWHFSNHPLLIQDEACRLLMLKPVTQALNRQEIATWKKVVRVINHELNNSLAPISSLCHSGGILASQLQEPKLDRVFDGISRRVKRLTGFIRNYSELAHAGAPDKKRIDLKSVLRDIHTLYPFRLLGDEGEILVEVDSGQLEQVLINLLKNAHESHQQEHIERPIELEVKRDRDNLIVIGVTDFGKGLSELQLNQAFVPFFTTKEGGSGIGLAMSKEIIQAHGGQISLSNHRQGGARAEIQLPC